MEFKPGDTVLVHSSSLKNNMEAKFKLSPRWFGPFSIVSGSNNTYRLRTVSGRLFLGKFHAFRSKKFYPDVIVDTLLPIPLLTTLTTRYGTFS